MVVIAVLLISSVAGVLFVKKYVCGGRSVSFLAEIVLLMKPKDLNINLSSKCERYINLSAVVCRFLVHRYSVLQHNAEANGIEGVDELLDTNVAGHPKTSFHEDSDEVW